VPEWQCGVLPSLLLPVALISYQGQEGVALRHTGDVRRRAVVVAGMRPNGMRLLPCHAERMMELRYPGIGIARVTTVTHSKSTLGKQEEAHYHRS
jgi:hypothetical protein